VADSFDYLPAPGSTDLPSMPGVRVRVGFGRRRLIGVVVGHSYNSRVAPQRLRPILKTLDAKPILAHEDLDLLKWVSWYYHHPLGEVIRSALPKRLRDGRPAVADRTSAWQLSSAALNFDHDILRRAPTQLALLTLLKSHPKGLDAARIADRLANWRRSLDALRKKGLVVEISRPCLKAVDVIKVPAPALNPDQSAAITTIVNALERFAAFVLQGVTGSGKTEVYLEVISRVVKVGRQALVLVPEIALTPQLVERFRARLQVPLAIMHSGLSEQERHCAWHMARVGAASIVIGTRSAIFTPLAAAGIIIVDEEHDGSFKQQDGLRYNARDLAVVRARLLSIPVILGSATPSLETLSNVERHRYRQIRLPRRAGPASPPAVEIVDVRRSRLENGISPYVLTQVGERLAAGDQVLIFLNRRGFAPALMCHDCGWVASCQRCDAKLTVHAARQRLCCHHCGAEQALTTRCPGCGSWKLLTLGEGTEQVEQALRSAFPAVPMVRVDRDTTRRKGELQNKLADIADGTHRLLIGTQMLSKGHDFPRVTLVVILNVDQNLCSSDFRATERIAQLIVQVSGRAGRGDRVGKVLLQTHRPDNPLLKVLLTQGYEAFSRTALSERRVTGLPPYRHMALLRAEATRRRAPSDFLRDAQVLLSAGAPAGVSVVGPAPAPMERRAGRYRAQLLLIATSRTKLHRLLDERLVQLHKLDGARSVRWTIDVDPNDML
jgi:primosomal protein N' (replication factor Y)